MKDVLIVEDTAAMLMVYDNLVTSAGHRVFCAETGTQAIKLFAHHKPKVILLDLMLPDWNGIDLMQEFFSIVPDLKIIVITANGSLNKAVEAMRLGAFDFLVKPVSDQRLIDTVNLAIERASDEDRAGDDTFHGTSETDLKQDLAVQRLVGLPYEHVERAFIEATIERCGGSLPKAAEMLKLAPSTLYRKRDSWLK